MSLGLWEYQWGWPSSPPDTRVPAVGPYSFFEVLDFVPEGFTDPGPVVYETDVPVGVFSFFEVRDFVPEGFTDPGDVPDPFPIPLGIDAFLEVVDFVPEGASDPGHWPPSPIDFEQWFRELDLPEEEEPFVDFEGFADPLGQPFLDLPPPLPEAPLADEEEPFVDFEGFADPLGQPFLDVPPIIPELLLADEEEPDIPEGFVDPGDWPVPAAVSDFEQWSSQAEVVDDFEDVVVEGYVEDGTLLAPAVVDVGLAPFAYFEVRDFIPEGFVDPGDWPVPPTGDVEQWTWEPQLPEFVTQFIGLGFVIPLGAPSAIDFEQWFRELDLPEEEPDFVPEGFTDLGDWPLPPVGDVGLGPFAYFEVRDFVPEGFVDPGDWPVPIVTDFEQWFQPLDLPEEEPDFVP